MWQGINIYIYIYIISVLKSINMNSERIKQKMNDLNAIDLEQAVKIIAGSARSMGIEVKD